jgi:hypothetical protein
MEEEFVVDVITFLEKAQSESITLMLQLRV